MNCGEVKGLIQLYLDSELDARGTLEAQRHLESCVSCARLLDALHEQDRLLKEAASAAAPNSARVRAEILDAIAREIQEEIQEEKTRRTTNRSPARWLKKAAWRRIAAAAVLALAATLLALRGGFMPGVNEAVYAAVAADHAGHYSADVMMGAVTDPDDLRRLVTTSAKVKAAPDLSAFGYGNPRGRVCRISKVEFLHLVYYHASQPPISLFLRPRDSSLISERLTALHSGNFNVVSISRAGVDLLVVSSLSEEHISSITRAIASGL